MSKNPGPLKDALAAVTTKDKGASVSMRAMHSERELAAAIAGIKPGDDGWLESKGERVAKIWPPDAGFVTKEARPITKVQDFIHCGAINRLNTVVAVHASAAGNNYRVREGSKAIPPRILAFIAPVDYVPPVAAKPETGSKLEI